MSESPTRTPLALTLGDDGAAGTFERWDGTCLTVRLPQAFAPGAPVRVLLALSTPLPIEGKSLGSRRDADGWFTVRLRPVTLPRSTRAALETLRDA